MPYIDSEIPDVSLVRMVFTACGKKETVVPKAAIKPNILTRSKFFMMLFEGKLMNYC